MKTMTEPQAWRYLAEHVFFNSGPIDTESFGGAWRYNSICFAAAELADGERVMDEVRVRMHRRVEGYLEPDETFAYTQAGGLNDRSEEARAARGMACLWLALDAEDEGK